jgi:hypothetical protein
MHAADIRFVTEKQDTRIHTRGHREREREREREKLPFVSKKENANFACV